MNNKKNCKKGPQWASLIFLYEVSIVVLIDFKAILVSRDIFLIQIIDTNNTNMYLIHFHNANIIKMRFLRVWFLKFQTRFRHLIFISEEKEKAYSAQNCCMHYNGLEPDLIFFFYYIYSYKF